MSPPPTAHPAHAVEPEWLVLLGVFLLGVLVILSRRPDAVFNPQFYIEDGRDWYAQAHDLGPLRALVIPHRGYVVLVQRLCAMIALAFPLAWAPLVMALLGAALDVVPAALVASSRFAIVVPSRSARLALASLCLAAPNAWTLTANATNSMWYLGLAACLVVLAAAPVGRTGRAVDLGVIIVSGLSGPFSILLAPVVALKWWLRRERWTLVLLLATAAAGLVQVASLLFTPATEGRMSLGADALKFGKLLVKRVIYEALFGQVGGMKIFYHEWSDVWTSRAMLSAVALAGFAMLVYAMLRAPLELRLFVVFAGVTFLAALFWPGGAAADATTWWELLTPAGNGNRYFLVPALAFLTVCVWMAASARPIAVRAAGAALLAVAVAVGIRLDWREPRYPDFDFSAAVKRYNAAMPGETVVVVTPPEWIMVLTKKANEPVVIEPDECTNEAPVDVTLLASNQITWFGRAGRAEGGDPHAIFGLPSRQHVCGVRVTFTLTSPGESAALLQMFWADGTERGISADERNSLILVTPGPAPQTATFHVHDTIDRIRLDPGGRPGSVFELERVVLLMDSNDEGVTVAGPVAGH